MSESEASLVMDKVVLEMYKHGGLGDGILHHVYTPLNEIVHHLSVV